MGIAVGIAQIRLVEGRGNEYGYLRLMEEP